MEINAPTKAYAERMGRHVQMMDQMLSMVVEMMPAARMIFVCALDQEGVNAGPLAPVVHVIWKVLHCVPPEWANVHPRWLAGKCKTGIADPRLI